MNSQTVSHKAVRPSSAGQNWPKKPKNGKHSRKLGFHGFDKKNLTTNNLQTVIFATYGLIIFGIDPIYNLRNDF